MAKACSSRIDAVNLRLGQTLLGHVRSSIRNAINCFKEIGNRFAGVLGTGIDLRATLQK